MIVLAIDPGPVTCGVVLYDSTARQVLNSYKAATVDEALSLCRGLEYDRIELVAIERVQSMGQAGASLLQTSEVVGRLHQRALDSGLPVVLLYRREVCSHLHVHGAGKDAQVRQRMIEAHGGSQELAVGTKRNPGPLYGVASHAWQALGLAYVAAERAAREEG
jgi:hypothetical protein